MENIYSKTKDELEKFLLDNNEKKYRVNQIIDWLYVKETGQNKPIVYPAQLFLGATIQL